MRGKGLRAQFGLLLMLSLSIFGLSDFNDDLLGKREQLSRRAPSDYGLVDVQPGVEPEDDSISDLCAGLGRTQGFSLHIAAANTKPFPGSSLANRARPPDEPLFLRHHVFRV